MSNNLKPKTAYYPERETKSLEFKGQIPAFTKLIKTCVAFANDTGGEIIIGVEDKTRKILGASDKDRERIYDDFPNSLYDSVSPSLIPDIYEKNLGSLPVLVIKIWAGSKKPYFVKNEGLPKGVYIRVGTSTRVANSDIIDDLMRQQRRITFDEESSGQDKSVLSNSLLRQVYGRFKSARLLQADKILVPDVHTQKPDKVSNGGILMFCELPDQHIAEAIIICSRFAGVSGRKIVQSLEIRGALPEQIESSFRLMSEWLQRDYVLNKTRFYGKTIIPEEALREAIINAVIHRKYNIPGPVKIAMYDNRLEIFSPGGFPGLININNLGDGTTYLRNHVIARIARKINLIERLGTGIKLIFSSCKKSGLSDPIYNEDGDFVKLTFPFQKKPVETVPSDEKILNLANQKGHIKPSDLKEIFDVSRNTVTRKLGGLVKSGKLVKHGKGAGTFYRIR